MSSVGKKEPLWRVLGTSLLVLSLMTGVAGADGHISVRVEFDEALGELPEGLAVDKTGNVFVSLAPLGRLLKVAPGSDQPEVFGHVPGINPMTDFGMLGLAADPVGNIYAGVQSSNPDANGVWVFDRDTGVASRIPGSEAIVVANDLAFDKRGNLYVTDSFLGAIWRVPKHGELEPWLVGDPNLAGSGVLGAGIPLGANGIEYHRGVLYVAVTEQFSLVKVPITRSGSPGATEVVATFPAAGFPGAPDGLAVDVHGDVYVALIAQQTIARVDQSGNVSHVASGDPLDWPSSIAFGTARGEQKTLFVVSFSIGEGFGDPVARTGPSLAEIAVGVPGLPLP